MCDCRMAPLSQSRGEYRFDDALRTLFGGSGATAACSPVDPALTPLAWLVASLLVPP